MPARLAPRPVRSATACAANRAPPKPHYAEITRTSVPQRVATLSQRTVVHEKGKVVEHAQSMAMMIGPTGALRTSDESTRYLVLGELEDEGPRFALTLMGSLSMGEIVAVEIVRDGG